MVMLVPADQFRIEMSGTSFDINQIFALCQILDMTHEKEIETKHLLIDLSLHLKAI